MKYLIATMTICVFLLSGCFVDHPAKAVENARKYALKNTQGLTALQQNYIRYNDPVIMQAVIFRNRQTYMTSFDHIESRYSKDDVSNPRADFMHTAIVWDVPGVEGSIVVDGTSYRDMRFWEANSLVRKRFIPVNTHKMQAWNNAKFFVMDRMPAMDKADWLAVRFAEPEVLYTDFPIAAESELEDAQKKGGWMEYLRKAADDKEPTQISLVWRIPGKKYSITVCGYSEDRSLGGWRPEKAFQTLNTELQKYVEKKNGNVLK